MDLIAGSLSLTTCISSCIYDIIPIVFSLRQSYSAFRQNKKLRLCLETKLFPRFHSNKRISSFTQSACNVCRTSSATFSRRQLPGALHNISPSRESLQPTAFPLCERQICYSSLSSPFSNTPYLMQLFHFCQPVLFQRQSRLFRYFRIATLLREIKLLPP